MPRYKLRTLLILLAVLPPVLWAAWRLWPLAETPAKEADLELHYEPGMFDSTQPGGS